MQAEARGKMKLIRFAPNRVGRVYAGGAEIDRLQGVEAPADGSWTRPEELGCFMAGTVLGGTAVVAAGRERLALAPGQTFALAASARPVFEGKAEILFALPPALHLRE